MTDYATVLAAASTLPITDQLRLIDELSSSIAVDVPPPLSEEWIKEIDRRIQEVDDGTAKTEPWEAIRKRSRIRLGLESAN